LKNAPDFNFAAMTRDTAPASLALNQQYEAMLSPLTLSALALLVEAACYARQTSNGEAFAIAYDQHGDYESENLDWFRARYDRFIYVDRIVIGDHLQGRGLARAFYQDLIAFARARGCEFLCAEVNIAPPNPASHTFHKKMGFDAVGKNFVGQKEVQYYVLKL